MAVVATAFVAVGIVLALSSGGTGHKYGTIPSWLPKQKVPVGRVVTASRAHPWLAIQGDSVLVKLGHAQVLATAVGPRVPEIGAVPVPATSPCTFVITFAKASGSVPLRKGDFSVKDELGKVHHLAMSAYGGGAWPGSVTPGRTVTISMSGVLPTGEGQIRWAPGGGAPVVSWDFDVEID